MKRSKVFVLTAAVAAGLVALGGTTAQQGKVTVEWWGHWASAIRRPTVDKIVAGFNNTSKTAQVNYTFVPFDQIITKTLAQVAAGDPPCVVALSGAELKIRASKNQLTDMSALGAESIKDRFIESAWSVGTYNGKQYGLPWALDTQMLFWRKADFREAGLDPNKAPRTWAELEQYAAKLTKREGNNLQRVGFHPALGTGGLQMWAQNAGADLFDAKNETAIVNSPTVVRTLQWMADWSKKYGGNPTFNSFRAGFGSGGGPTDPFPSGKVSMIIANGGPYSTELARNAPNVEYGMAPVPTPNGKLNANSSAGTAFTIEIPRGCKNPQAAFEFARYMATEGARLWAKEQSEPVGAKAAAAALTTPVQKQVVTNLRYTTFGVAPTFAPAFGTSLAKAVDDVLIGGKDPKGALDEAQAAITRQVTENRR